MYPPYRNKEEFFRTLKQLLQDDPRLQEELRKQLIESYRKEYGHDPPADFIEDAIKNVINWLVERIKEIYLAIMDTVRPALEDFWEDMLNEIYETIDPGERIEPYEAPRQAAKYVALTQSILMTSTIMTMALQLIPGVNLTVVRCFLDNIYWGLGLGFLGWQVMAPPTRKAVLEPLDEYYNRRYRTRQMPPGTARLAYRYGTITKYHLEDILMSHGWDDKSMDAVISLEDKRLADRVRPDRLVPRAVAEWAYWYDLISREDLTDVYRAHRYSDEAIAILMARADRRKEEIKASSPQLSEKTAAFKSAAESMRKWILQLRRFGATDAELAPIMNLYNKVKEKAIKAMIEDIPKRVEEWQMAAEESEEAKKVPVEEIIKRVPGEIMPWFLIAPVPKPIARYRAGSRVRVLPYRKARRLPRRVMPYSSPIVRDIDIYLSNCDAVAKEIAKKWKEIMPKVPVVRPEVIPEIMRIPTERVVQAREWAKPVRPARIPVPAVPTFRFANLEELIRATREAGRIAVPPKPPVEPVRKPGEPVRVSPIPPKKPAPARKFDRLQRVVVTPKRPEHPAMPPLVETGRRVRVLPRPPVRIPGWISVTAIIVRERSRIICPICREIMWIPIPAYPSVRRVCRRGHRLHVTAIRRLL